MGSREVRKILQKVTGEGAECGSQDALGDSSLLFLMEQCGLALWSQAPCHLEEMRSYYSLPGGLGLQNLVCGAQTKLESVVSLSSLHLLWKCRVWDIRT